MLAGEGDGQVDRPRDQQDGGRGREPDAQTALPAAAGPASSRRPSAAGRGARSSSRRSSGSIRAMSSSVSTDPSSLHVRSCRARASAGPAGRPTAGRRGTATAPARRAARPGAVDRWPIVQTEPTTPSTRGNPTAGTAQLHTQKAGAWPRSPATSEAAEWSATPPTMTQSISPCERLQHLDGLAEPDADQQDAEGAGEVERQTEPRRHRARVVRRVRTRSRRRRSAARAAPAAGSRRSRCRRSRGSTGSGRR